QRIGDARLRVEVFDDSGDVPQHPLAQLLRRGEVLGHGKSTLADTVLQYSQSVAPGRVIFGETGVQSGTGRAAKIKKAWPDISRFSRTPWRISRAVTDSLRYFVNQGCASSSSSGISSGTQP